MEGAKVFTLGPMEADAIIKIVHNNMMAVNPALKEWPGDLDPQIIKELAEGNPGAATVLAQLYGACGLWPIEILYREGSFKGPNLWVLYKDWHDQDIASLILAIERLKVDDERPNADAS